MMTIGRDSVSDLFFKINWSDGVTRHTDTYSNRWFPSKAIRLWTELQEFERTGLVLEYFRSTGLFSEYQSYSIRGLLRPRHDKYYGKLPFSDPVYAVWGQRV